MKKLFILNILLIVFCTCTKDDNFDADGNYGEGTALLNGIQFKGVANTFYSDKAFCKPDTCIAMHFKYKNKEGFLRGIITMSNIPLLKGKFILGYSKTPSIHDYHYTFSYSELEEGGDVLTGIYFIYEFNPENFLNVQKLDLLTGDIEGTFQATVVRSPEFTISGSVQDTIVISNGLFHGKIYR